jgi:prevent-host-death family protein
MEIAISEFKAKCIQVLKKAAASDEEWVVTLRGKPLARVVGIREGRPARVLGSQGNALDARTPDSVLMRSDFAGDWDS